MNQDIMHISIAEKMYLHLIASAKRRVGISRVADS